MNAPTITGLDCGWLRTQERTLVDGGSTEQSSIPIPAWLVRHERGVVLFDAGLHPAACVVHRGGWVACGRGVNLLVEGQATDLGGGTAFYSQGVRLEPI